VAVSKDGLQYRFVIPGTRCSFFGNIIVEVGDNRLGCAGAESILPIMAWIAGSFVSDAPLARRGMTATPPKKKKDQLALAQDGDKLFLRTGPIPTAPGGWGLRNPGLKRPGQRSNSLSQFRWAVAGRKLGRIMISLTIP
jgi:hypothetical protein